MCLLMEGFGGVDGHNRNPPPGVGGLLGFEGHNRKPTPRSRGNPMPDGGEKYDGGGLAKADKSNQEPAGMFPDVAGGSLKALSAHWEVTGRIWQGLEGHDITDGTLHRCIE